MHFLAAGDGEPLVLLHGFPETSHAWRKVMPALARRFRVIAPDLRGSGQSGRPAAGYDKQGNIGETERPWHITYRSRPAEATWPAGWDERFPIRFGAEILDGAGALVGYSMRQARDEAGGLHLRVTAFLPAAVPGHVLERHGRHLATEYRNWIAIAASELSPPPASRTPDNLQEDNDES